ncbi:MAG: peptide deformylase [Spirochaetota bacterium]
METLPIVTYPAPLLRRTAEEVHLPDETLSELVNDMFAAMQENDGVGLAAPQVGVSRRIIVVSLEDKEFSRLALINPTVEYVSQRTGTAEEGCLSIPGVRADVRRPVEAVVRGTTRSGRTVEITARDLLARVLLHEIDHLNGVLFIDRVDRRERSRIASDLAALEQRYQVLKTS